MSHPLPPLDAAPAAVIAWWSLEPAVLLPAVGAAAVYVNGWMTLRERMPERFGIGRLTAFLSGLTVVGLALCSPIDALSARLLQAHMIQHLMLMVVAPPLLWLGAPVAPLLLGLPRPARQVVAEALATGPMRWLTRLVADPRVAWVSFIAAFWIWHVPALYDLALRSEAWHHVEHACFFLSGCAFWRPVIGAWPARALWPRWAMIVYLLLAETQNTLLSAILTFSDRVIYPFYTLAAERPGALSPLEDQALAGAIMWVPGSLAFALPVLWLLISLLVEPAPAALARSDADEHAVSSVS